MINVDVERGKNTLARYAFYVNVIGLFVLIIKIYNPVIIGMTVTGISCFLLFCYVMIEKYKNRVVPLVETHSVASQVNKIAGKIHGKTSEQNQE